jgi:hypothetical protein
MIPVTRPMAARDPNAAIAQRYRFGLRGVRQVKGATPRVTVPLPVNGPGGTFNGMDPSDPSTYVRPWNPQPGMIGRLNFDGAAVQGNTNMGGVWSPPAYQVMPVGGRPNRRPR